MLQHTQLIKRIANHIKCRLPPHIELDDLIQAGLIGLLQAKKCFDPEKGASFETYASIKIHSAIIDDLRRNTGITRQLSENIKSVTAAKSKLEHDEHSEMISSVNIAKTMGVSIEKYSNMMSEIQAYRAINTYEGTIIDELPFDEFQNPSVQAENEEIKHAIKTVITGLSKREQHILALYYNEQLNFNEGVKPNFSAKCR